METTEPTAHHASLAESLRNWSDNAGTKELLAVLATKNFTESDWRAYFFEDFVDLSQNGFQQVESFKEFLRWKFRCEVATSDTLGLECLSAKVYNKTK